MCLYEATKINPKEDITCYKLVETGRLRYSNTPPTNPVQPPVLRSPYYSNKTWKLGKTETLNKCIHPELVGSEIYGGAYHSYASLLNAVRVASKHSMYEVAVLKCIIPKSSKYVYKGTVYSGDKGFASQKLKPVKVVYLNSTGFVDR